MCRSQAEGGRRCTGHGNAQTAPRPKHVYCNCMGSHAENCPNYGVPGAMPPLIPDTGSKKGGKK